MQLSREIARKVVETVDAGLCRGMGEPQPGEMCVEAAVCYALGLPHSDEPPCVGSAARAFKIRLNDSGWSSNKARAKGMRRVAVAQLGSNEIDQAAFTSYVAEQTIRRIVPIALRAAAALSSDHAESLEAAAVRCEQEGTKEAAAYAAYAAYAYAYADAAAAATYAYAYADAADADAAYAADADAAYAAYAAAADAAAAAAADAAAAAARDQVLSLAAEIAVEALIKLGAKGTEWLDLCA